MSINIAEHPFIDKWRASGYQYFQVSKGMLQRASQYGLALDDVLLYNVLRDRTGLSGENKWIDDDGRVYIIYTRENAARFLRCSKRRVIDGFRNLVNAGLLKEVEQPKKTGNLKNAPKKLYVRMWITPNGIGMTEEELKEKGFPYITEENLCFQDDNYYIVPLILFEGDEYKDLSTRAIMTYSIALDKLHLSIKYNRVDDDGFVWCGLEADELGKELGCSVKSIWRAYKELEDIGLFVRKRANYGAKYQYRFYLRDYLPAPISGAPKDLDHTPFEEVDPTREADKPPGPDRSSPSLGGTPDSYAPRVCPPNDRITPPQPQHLDNFTPRPDTDWDRSVPRDGQECTTDRTGMHYGLDRNTPRTGQEVTPARTESDVGPDRNEPGYRTELHRNQNPRQSYLSNSLITSIKPAAADAPDEAALRRLDASMRAKAYMAVTYAQTFSDVQKQLNYQSLCEDIYYYIEKPEDQQLACEYVITCIELMAKDMISPAPQIRFGNELIDKTDVLVNYGYINEFILLTMLRKVLEHRFEIKNMEVYLHRALYMAWEHHAGESFYTQSEIQKKKERRSYGFY